MPADLRVRANFNPRAEKICKQLSPETNPEHRAIVSKGVFDQRAHGAEPRMRIDLLHAVRSAENNQVRERCGRRKLSIKSAVAAHGETRAFRPGW